MKELHASVSGAHLGVKKLIYSLFACVFLLKLHDYISEFIATCDACKKKKFYIVTHWSAATTANSHSKIHFL